MKLWDYQEKAKRFIQEHKRVYLALDLGMGKTITSLASTVEQNKNILLIAEKNEIVNSQNFKKEVDNHFEGVYYYNLREENPLEESKGGIFVGGINPDGINKLPDDLVGEVKSMIIDEATLAKTTTTKRFKKVHKIAKEVDNLVLLSGTPMMNGASELYAPLLLLENSMVAGKGKKGQIAFETVFAGGHRRKIRNTGKWFQDYMWWAKGANNVRELRYLLRDQFFIMNKDETGVFKKKTRRIEWVDMSMEWLYEYGQAWNDYFATAKTREVDLDNITELRNLIENGQCYQVNSRWKAGIVAKHIADGRYGDKRIIVFTKYIESDTALQKSFDELGVRYKTFEDLKEWKEGDEQVLVGRIGSHAKGGNVPEACVCIFVDMDYVPSNNIQAENRIDRPEQKNEMEIIYYMAKGDDIVDSHIRKINQNKMRKINKFMKPLTTEEIAEMPQRLQSLRDKFPKETALLEI